MKKSMMILGVLALVGCGKNEVKTAEVKPVEVAQVAPVSKNLPLINDNLTIKQIEAIGKDMLEKQGLMVLPLLKKDMLTVAATDGRTSMSFMPNESGVIDKTSLTTGYSMSSDKIERESALAIMKQWGTLLNTEARPVVVELIGGSTAFPTEKPTVRMTEHFIVMAQTSSRDKGLFTIFVAPLPAK